jgi:2-iminobutanoate/2-iminopropanoate deaminase
MRLINPESCPPVNPSYSQAALWNGLVFVAGQIGVDPNSGCLVSERVGPQTEQLFQNLSVILAASNSSFHQTLRVNVYLVDLADWTEMNSVYTRYFGDHAPPKTTVVVSELALGARVEIEIIAHAS